MSIDVHHQLYYEVHGEGKPLLLIAGLGSDSQSWLPVMDIFAEDFQTIVFDNKGSGRSDAPKPEYGIGQMADDAAMLLDHLDIQSAHVMGHSMGGYIAQELAINHPDRIDKLVLVSTSAVSSKRNNQLFSSFHEKWRQGMDMELWFRDMLFWLFSPQRFDNKEFIDEFIQFLLNYPYLQSMTNFEMQVKAISNFDSREIFLEIQAEALVLVGDEDILITPSESQALFDGISGANCAVHLPNVAHSMFLEDPDISSKAVLDFLKV